MAENRPPNRPTFHRARSGDPYPDDRDRANKARQAAEALFAPKQQAVESPAAPTRPAADDRVSAASRASSAPVLRNALPVIRKSEAAPPATRNTDDEAAAPGIPASHVTRIRTWLRYGMKIAEVAQIYGVEIDDIERVLGKP
jgi:hypothetical protein